MIEALLHLLVNVKHTETEIVPELGVSSEGIGCFLEVSERLHILFLLEEGESEVEKNISGSLRVQ